MRADKSLKDLGYSEAQRDLAKERLDAVERKKRRDLKLISDDHLADVMRKWGNKDG